MLDVIFQCKSAVLHLRKARNWWVIDLRWSVCSNRCTLWRWWRRRWSRSPSPSPCSCWRHGSGQGWTPWSTQNQPCGTFQSSISSQPAPPICHMLWWPRSRLLPLRLRPTGNDAVRLGGQRESRSKMTAAQVGWKWQAGRCWCWHSKKCGKKADDRIIIL